MITIHGGPPARRALALLTTLILTAGALAVGAPAHAAPVDPDNPDNLPTFVNCVRGANKGKMHAVVPVGPGRVLVLGWARPCRPPKATDATVIADMDAESGLPAGGSSVVQYQRTVRGYFGRIVTLSATTRRVCLADTPKSATDCYAVRVPERNGKLGVPVVHGRTTTARIEIPTSIGFCGSCW